MNGGGYSPLHSRATLFQTDGQKPPDVTLNDAGQTRFGGGGVGFNNRRFRFITGPKTSGLPPPHGVRHWERLCCVVLQLSRNYSEGR